MKRILMITVLLLCSLSLLARPAYPGWRTVKQPDGSSLKVLSHGDEWGHYLTDTQGRVVVKGEDGFYRVSENVTPQMASRLAAARRQARVKLRNQAAKAGEHVAVGQKHFLVILCAFKDQAFTTGNVNAEVTNMLNQAGYSKNGATGSARDFYYQNSNGYFEPIFDVYGPVTLPQNKSYYGGNDSNGNDKNAEQAVADGCKAMDSQIDFSQYDIDGNGYVDMVFMFYSGYGEADSEDADSIWPHMFYLSEANINLTLDGKVIDQYACANELAGYGSLEGKLDGIGAVCHEFGHAMGLPDFYDTDGDTGGRSGGTYDFSTMCSGNYNNYSRTPPYFNMEERILLGWEDASTAYQEFTENGTVSIPLYNPENGSPVAYKTPTDVEGEYYVYECRGSNGWDAYLSGYGLVVYHIDRSSVRTVKVYGQYNATPAEMWADWINWNSLNNNGSHPCAYIVVSADQNNYNYAPSYYSGYGYVYNEDGDKVVFPGAQNITTFNPVSWNKVPSPISFSNISYSGSAVNLTVQGIVKAGVDYPYIANPGKGSYTAGSSFALTLVVPDEYPLQNTQWKLDGVSVNGSSVTLASGNHSIEATLTLQDGKKEIITLEVTAK